MEKSSDSSSTNPKSENTRAGGADDTRAGGSDDSRNLTDSKGSPSEDKDNIPRGAPTDSRSGSR